MQLDASGSIPKLVELREADSQPWGYATQIPPYSAIRTACRVISSNAQRDLRWEVDKRGRLGRRRRVVERSRDRMGQGAVTLFEHH